MKKICFLSIAILLCGCMTNRYAEEKSSSKLAGAAADSGPMCEDKCAGVATNPDLLGCVLNCSSFQAQKVVVNVGKSIYGTAAPTPSCRFTYEKRDADRVAVGAFYEAFDFSFALSSGVGDGSFYQVGSGLVNSNQTIDFNKEIDQKETGDVDEGGVSSLTFSRINPAYSNLPTFMATGTDATSETKTLMVVLAQDFNPQKPFSKIVAINYTARRGKEIKYDVVCQP